MARRVVLYNRFGGGQKQVHRVEEKEGQAYDGIAGREEE